MQEGAAAKITEFSNQLGGKTTESGAEVNEQHLHIIAAVVQVCQGRVQSSRESML